MLELSRIVRLCLNADTAHAADPAPTDAKTNTFAAWPPPRGLARYVEVRVTCRGLAHERTGYFINIRDIDDAVRRLALPRLFRAVRDESAGRPVALGMLVHGLLGDVQPALHQAVASVELQLTPVTTMTAHADQPNVVLLRQRYEFSAAHRLHVPEYSDQRNRDIFGKCNNPAGHGHNYTFEVAVECPIDADGRTLGVGELDAAVDEHAVDRLDHKHLNHDVAEFADVNPSVENIAQVIWGFLAGRTPGRSTLREVTVWETGKTSCTYRGPSPSPTARNA
ncbi:MAG: 6-carboxytetrahydropterin synthase [Planctomycetota bacterium]